MDEPKATGRRISGNGGRAERKVNVSVMFSNENLWLSQRRMSELYAVDMSTINYHLKQLDESGEVHLSGVIRKNQIPNNGVSRFGRGQDSAAYSHEDWKEDKSAQGRARNGAAAVDV